MANYKRVVLKESNKDYAQNNYSVDVPQQEIRKFDKTYTSKKLNDLYNEFDSITFNNNVASETIIKNDVAMQTTSVVNVKTIVYLSAAIVVTLLLAFLAIYNIFVINGLNSNIKLLQEDVAATQLEFQNLQNTNAPLSEEELRKLINESLEGNYGDISENGFVDIDMLKVENVKTYEATSNWFDQFCTFLSNVFGG